MPEGQKGEIRWLPLASIVCLVFFVVALSSYWYGLLQGIGMTAGLATIWTVLALGFKDHQKLLYEKWVYSIEPITHLILIWLFIVMAVFMFALPRSSDNK